MKLSKSDELDVSERESLSTDQLSFKKRAQSVGESQCIVPHPTFSADTNIHFFTAVKSNRHINPATLNQIYRTGPNRPHSVYQGFIDLRFHGPRIIFDASVVGDFDYS